MLIRIADEGLFVIEARSPQTCQSAGTLPFNQGAQLLSDKGCFFRHSCDLLGLSQQLIINV
jgi:hypothetical protein